jgi:glycosyltransferase involved in cell wall biosynthesis
MNKRISIVLPVYNGERYLRESIDSVIDQTYPAWELLILDDCSTDGSAQIAKEYAKKDPRIHYYRNEHNLGLPRNLNKGFSLAKGEYLTWTSDDNRYRPHALERMISVLETDPETQFVFGACRIIDENGVEIEYISVSPSSPRWIVGSNSVGACFLYTRKAYETVGEYDPDLKLVEDFDYWQRICARFKAVGISEILYDYRFHPGALTSTMNQETFRRNLEKTLLKNRPAFGKLDVHQSYLFYKSLHECRAGDPEDPYFVRYQICRLLNLVVFRVPRKLARLKR